MGIDDRFGYHHLRYILDEHGDPVPEPDLMKWGAWLARHHPCTVARTELANGLFVSTIFLGLDHGFGGPRPVLFETMVFMCNPRTGGLGPALDQLRAHDWAEAAVDHLAAVAEYQNRAPGD